MSYKSPIVTNTKDSPAFRTTYSISSCTQENDKLSVSNTRKMKTFLFLYSVQHNQFHFYVQIQTFRHEKHKKSKQIKHFDENVCSLYNV